MRDILPTGGASSEDRQALLAEMLASKQVRQVAKKQRANGSWGDNILGTDPGRGRILPTGGTVSQYRRLLELGVPSDDRALRLADRVFYRLLSRDESPELAFEFKTAAKSDPELGIWARTKMREAAVSALAHGGFVEDPRVRGAAHRVASDISQFLRSPLAEKPLIRRGARTLLHPEAYPPTLHSVAVIAFMPSLQRERAGFVERLSAYLSRPAGKRTFVIPAGKRFYKPVFELIGDPLHADAAGRTVDIPFALHWIELLVRLGCLAASSSATNVLARLVSECDDRGVWSPRAVRSMPKSPSKFVDFAFPLEADGKTDERRRADVTFRLALIARLAGWQLSYA